MVAMNGPAEKESPIATATFADYVSAPVTAMARIPEGITMEQAAALPLAATTALECLRAADPRPGGSALVNGASGGVGTFVLQLARSMGLETTAMCSSRNVEQARALGAHRVVDYAREDFARAGAVYDTVVDLVGNRRLRDLRRVVSPGGCLVLSGGGVQGEGRLVGPVGLLIRAKLVSRGSGVRTVTPLAVPTTEVLEHLARLCASGALASVIERTYRFEDAAAALGQLERAHARGKVVVTFGPSQPSTSTSA